jgi:hypothetical protein
MASPAFPARYLDAAATGMTPRIMQAQLPVMPGATAAGERTGRYSRRVTQGFTRYEAAVPMRQNQRLP